ncbi:hypothetical protein C2845_PM08G18520 [Panicum miliaceum]|uniref:DUF1618 domain-containing protein n=1 Tax=Panicum miliaceum TaxID=4540 RepID=A0A3L6QZX9_PANMI|nr:hypothetical protein C2845_PM08G18520 [Panicum miliaceum]
METPVPGHNKRRRLSGGSSPLLLAVGAASSSRTDPRIRAAFTGRPGPSRRPGRSTRDSSEEEDATAVSPAHPAWVILNRAGARRDGFPGDRTTSVTSRTSAGEKVSVSFELAKPPGTSVLTLDWPQGPASIYPQVIAAHRNVVLLVVPRGVVDRPGELVVDYFIYEASSDPSRRSSLSLARRDAVDIYLLVSGWSANKSKWYDEWRVLKRLPVRCENGDLLDLSRWSTDRVLPYRHHLIWVNYYRGMIMVDMEDPWRQRPRSIRYVPLPVDAAKRMIRDDWNYGRRCHEAYHNIFATGSTIKFVTIINQQHSSSSSSCRCRSTFRITVWSLCNHSDTWVEEATLDAEEFWALDPENRLPHVVPEFPVFDMKNPDAICFSLNEGDHTFGYSGKTWMVEVHTKNKVLLNATAYSEEWMSFYGQITTKSARVLSQGLALISSEMPHYLPEKRRKWHLILLGNIYSNAKNVFHV